jgi:phytoene synthase
LKAGAVDEVDANSDVVRLSAREGDSDRYLAALLAARAVRDDLVALAAFSGAVMKVPYQISEAQIGEIRLQWWRDALEQGVAGTKSGDPVADAFADVLARKQLDVALVGTLLDQLVARCYGQEITDIAQFEQGIAETQGVLFKLAWGIAGGVLTPAAAVALHAASQAYGLAVVALRLPLDLARGIVPLPPEFTGGNDFPEWRDVIGTLRMRAFVHLVTARTALGAGRTPQNVALLPAALVGPYFEALSRATHDASRDITDISPLARAWHLGKARVLGRF